MIIIQIISQVIVGILAPTLFQNALSEWNNVPRTLVICDYRRFITVKNNRVIRTLASSVLTARIICAFSVYLKSIYRRCWLDHSFISFWLNANFLTANKFRRFGVPRAHFIRLTPTVIIVWNTIFTAVLVINAGVITRTAVTHATLATACVRWTFMRRWFLFLKILLSFFGNFFSFTHFL